MLLAGALLIVSGLVGFAIPGLYPVSADYSSVVNLAKLANRQLLGTISGFAFVGGILFLVGSRLEELLRGNRPGLLQKPSAAEPQMADAPVAVHMDSRKPIDTFVYLAREIDKYEDGFVVRGRPERYESLKQAEASLRD